MSGQTTGWTEDELDRIDKSDELEIVTSRDDGTLRRWTPIWVVRVDDGVYVRTWQRRDTGWFGDVVRRPQARIRVPGVDADVTVHEEAISAGIDAAYQAKYGRYGDATVSRMVSEDAAATTLRLAPARPTTV